MAVIPSLAQVSLRDALSDCLLRLIPISGYFFGFNVQCSENGCVLRMKLVKTAPFTRVLTPPSTPILSRGPVRLLRLGVYLVFFYV